MRVGVSATYGKWKAKVGVGFARQSLSLKDICLDYNFNKENLIRMGYFVHQFGLQSGTSSSFKITMEEPLANQAFFNSRLIGAMFVHAGEKYHTTASVFAENDAMKMTADKLGNEAWGAMTRLVWHPTTEHGKIFHVGVSGAYESPRYNKNAAHPFTFSLLKAFSPFHLFSLSPFHPFTLSPFHPFTFSPFHFNSSSSSSRLFTTDIRLR